MIKSRRLRRAGHVVRKKEGSNAFKILIGKLSGKRPLRKPAKRGDNIRMNLEEMVISTINWVDSAQDMDYRRALVNAKLNTWVFVSHGVNKRIMA